MSIKKQLQKGMTLVEITIVIVIIGLIVSITLVGQDLIESAEIRGTVSQFSEYNAAVGAFKAKYNQIPGDAPDRFGFVDGDGNTGVSFGNGNGLLEDSDVGNAENVFFWNHLGTLNTSLVGGAYSGLAGDPIDEVLPRAKSGGFWYVFTNGGINYYAIGIISALTGTGVSHEAALTPLTARAIDEKVDDGNPTEGLVRAVGSGTGVTDFVTARSDGAMGDAATCTAGDDLYNTPDEVASCNIVIRMPF